MAADTEAMMEKVRKLIALADATKTTEAEATAAALKIQELVQTYGLDIAQIEAENPNSQHGVREMGTVGRRAMFDYQQDLMKTIAENNFCHYDVRTIYVERKNRNSKQHFLVGRKINIEATGRVYDYLIETMKRLCERQNYQAHATRNLFYEGCTKRLTERLKDQRFAREQAEKYRQEQARARGEQVNALVLSDVYGSEADMNNDTLNGWPIGTTAQRRAQNLAKETARKEVEAAHIARGVDRVVAFYLSHGYDHDSAVLATQQWRQEVRRRQRKQQRSTHTGFTMHERKEAGRTRSSAYQAGQRAGDEIGLDDQIDEIKRKRLT